MAGSGVFPKVDGDILYAYDVNGFSKNNDRILFRNFAQILHNDTIRGFSSGLNGGSGGNFYNIQYNTFMGSISIGSGVEITNKWNGMDSLIPISGESFNGLGSNNAVNQNMWAIGSTILNQASGLLVVGGVAGQIIKIKKI